jgi:hypothetical protein
MQKFAERDAARIKDLPTFEELNTKDVPLNQLLNQLSGAIRPQPVNVREGLKVRGLGCMGRVPMWRRCA